MSNEELAIRIQQGEEYLIPQLWEQVVKFIAMKAREYISHKGQQGLPCSGEETDLTNQAYFGFLEAVKYFNPEAGKFLTILSLSIKTSFAEAAGYRTAAQRLASIRDAVSGDAPVGEDDFSLFDTIPDGGESVEEQATRELYRAFRGYTSARLWYYYYAALSYSIVGFRPVLEILNTDPLISDSDRDLGDKNSNFTITYTVDDADSGDVLTATESLDGQTTKSFAPTRNLVNTISVDVDSLSLGKHTVKVVVSDGQGGTATRTWTFTRTNSAPTISGSDGNLGDKNLGFTYAYTIDDADGDTLTVVEELNDETIRTINNAPKGEELTVTITSEKLYALGLNSVNTLKITVTDGKGGTAYRRVTFKRTNSAPTISGQDKALGLKNGSFAENYTVSDVEGDNVVVTEFVDDVQIRSYQATLGQQETIELTREKWLSLTNGQHQLRIEAVDGNFATSVRVFSFSKKETVIKFELAAPEETDAAATKVLVTPTWKIEGAVAKVEACNNGFDAVPTWEDITAMVQINRVYNFTNKTKTASKWGVNIRFTITKNEGFEGEVSISGFGGAYE